jgi:hypothetical protein
MAVLRVGGSGSLDVVGCGGGLFCLIFGISRRHEGAGLDEAGLDVRHGWLGSVVAVAPFGVFALVFPVVPELLAIAEGAGQHCQQFKIAEIAVLAEKGGAAQDCGQWAAPMKKAARPD